MSNDHLKLIICIDDHIATNIYNQRIINKAIAVDEIQSCTQAEQALDYLKKLAPKDQKPNVIFLDINMPSMNGWEFLEEYSLLKDYQKSDIVLIMLTTSLNEEDRIRAETNPEVTDFINKPLSVEQVKKLVDQYIIS